MIPQIYVLLFVFVGMPLLFILIIFLLFKNRILSFLYPNEWVEIEMLERDNSITNWLQKKEKDLQFIFNAGKYNMFEIHDTIEDTAEKVKDKDKITPPDEIPTTKHSIKVFTSIYRHGRLAKLYYMEGSQNPMDYRTGIIKGDAQQSMQLEKAQISEILNVGNGTEEFFKKYGLIIIIAIAIIIIIMLFK